MFVSKLQYKLLVKGTKRILTRSLVCRVPNRFSSSSSSRTLDQLDIDKKNGVLAYVPSDSSFDLQPLSGAFRKIIILSIDKDINTLTNKKTSESHIAEENKVTREVFFCIEKLLTVIKEAIRIGRECY